LLAPGHNIGLNLAKSNIVVDNIVACSLQQWQLFVQCMRALVLATSMQRLADDEGIVGKD
jgi:hypothetical protein